MQLAVRGVDLKLYPQKRLVQGFRYFLERNNKMGELHFLNKMNFLLLVSPSFVVLGEGGLSLPVRTKHPKL